MYREMAALEDPRPARLFAVGFGLVYLLVGIIGFFPFLYSDPPAGAPTLTVDNGYGYLLGLFPTNVLHNAFHIVIGLLGIISAARYGSAKFYCGLLFVVFGVLALMGVVPATHTAWGLIPIFSADAWLHAATALAAAIFGFGLTAPSHVPPMSSHSAHH